MIESPHSVSDILSSAYPDNGFMQNFLIRYRPYICPFHKIAALVPESSSVLEIGCGVGLMTILLSYLGKAKKGIGFDTSKDAINTSRSAITPDDCDITFRHLKKDDPWPKGSFDYVICIDVLHHVPPQEQRQFISKIVRSAKNATVIFKDVSPKPFYKALASYAHDLIIARQLINIQNERQVINWFKKDGLFVIQHRRLDMLWYSHYMLELKL